MRTFFLVRGEAIFIGDSIIVRVVEVGDDEVKLVIERPGGVSVESVEVQELVGQGADESESAI